MIAATDPTGFFGRASGLVTRDGVAVSVNVYLYGAVGTAAGRVLRPDRTTPVPNAEVVVSGPAGPLAFAVTDGDGVYEVGSVPVGPITAEVFEAATARRGFATGARVALWAGRSQKAGAGQDLRRRGEGVGGGSRADLTPAAPC